MTVRHDLYCFIQGVPRVTYTMIYCNIIVSFDKFFIDYSVYLCPKPSDYYIKTSIDPYIYVINHQIEKASFQELHLVLGHFVSFLFPFFFVKLNFVH